MALPTEYFRYLLYTKKGDSTSLFFIISSFSNRIKIFQHSVSQKFTNRRNLMPTMLLLRSTFDAFISQILNFNRRFGPTIYTKTFSPALYRKSYQTGKTSNSEHVLTLSKLVNYSMLTNPIYVRSRVLAQEYYSATVYRRWSFTSQVYIQ